MTEREYAIYVRDIIVREMDSLDVIYKDIILLEVGMYGFNAMLKYGLIECCGSMNNRELYVLC